MGNRSDDPIDEVIDMVSDTMKSVAAVERDLTDRVTETELRSAEKDLRDYADGQIDKRHRDQGDSLKQLMENMGNSLLNDFEEMGKDTEARLFGRLEKFINDELTPLVGRLVNDEVKRKDQIAEREREKAEADRKTAELEEELRKQKARNRVFAYVSALGVVVTMIWTGYRLLSAINGAG